MDVFDITVPIRLGMPVYQGDPEVSIERVASIAAGGICNISRLDCSVHAGTHIDAPVHFIEGAQGVEATPLDALIGPAAVVDARLVKTHLDAAVLRSLDIPSDASRLLFLTGNSALWEEPQFSTDYIGLTEDGAEYLIGRGVRTVGIDYLSIAPYADPAPTHISLLSAGVVVLEGLDLRGVEPGAYRLACLPMLIEGADGAPARALLMAG